MSDVAVRPGAAPAPVIAGPARDAVRTPGSGQIEVGPSATAVAPGWRRTFVALRHRDFAIIMAGTLPAMLAMQMGQVAFGYLAYELTGSATTLGLMGLAWGVPMLLLSLVGGVVADRVPRRTILMATQGAIGCAAFAAAVLVATGALQIWHLFVVALVQGTSFAFNMPARQALSAEVVGKEDLANGLALFNANMNLTRVIGPAVAGFLIGSPRIGVGGVFTLMAAAYVLVLIMFWQIRGGRVRAASGRGSSVQQLKDGLLYIKGSRQLVLLLTLGFLPLMLGMPYQMLMPVFALGVLRVGPEGLGMLNAAVGIGALIGSLALAALGNFTYKNQLQTGMGIAFGVSLLLFAISPTFTIALIVLPVLGGASAAYMALNNTLVMEHTPRELYGRVMSVYMMTFSLMPLSTVPFARLADEIGPRPTMAVAGALLAYIVAVVAFGNRLGRRPAA